MEQTQVFLPTGQIWAGPLSMQYMSGPIGISKEEKLNTISHGIGVLLSITGSAVLLIQNTGKTNLATFSLTLYSISLISMFLVSTLYHFLPEKQLKQKVRVLDHINIYFLIAGTYSPVALIILENGNGWFIFYAVWAIAALGTLLKIFFTGRYEIISLLLYLAMGWLIIFDFQNLLDNTTNLGFSLMLIGGAFYTIGILFYAIEKIPHNHFIWHLFVLAGAITHWFFIYVEVA